MPGKFNGWLIKFGDVTLPNSFLLADGWESTPNQRVEIDAYRDANICCIGKHLRISKQN